MIKHASLFLLTLVAFIPALHAQTTTDQLSTGTGYTKFAYYKLTDGSNQQIANDAWDIAFSNLGTQTAGIFINESTSSSMGQAIPGMEAYDPYIFDFSESIDPGSAAIPEFQIFNPEASWAEGAFNSMRDTSNALDFGWGIYDPGQSKIQGDRVFVLKLRNGQFRKIIFDEYNGSQFTFRVANLDGSSPSTHTITTALSNGSPVVYFSLGPNGSNVTTATNWDLVFCRYNEALSDGAGDFINYNVTGVLSADGVQTAKATNVDPNTVDYTAYLDSFSKRLDVINQDWKFFDFSLGWIVADDRAYFVKTSQNQLYKLVFIAFGGSINGTATLERTYLGQLSEAADLPAGIQAVSVYPNPVADRLSLAFTTDMAAPVALRLMNQVGQTVWTGVSRTADGLNILEINDLPSLPVGIYTLTVQLPGGQFSRAILVGR